jgi:hypothetical protein
MTVFNRHPKASYNDTLGILAKATDARDPAPLKDLAAIGRDYQALAEDLAAVPVPKTLAPLHQEVVRNLAGVAAQYQNLALVVSDPIKGLAAVQQYQQLMSETGNVLTNIAQVLKNGGILFSKDEPGSGWEIFLSAS